MLHTARPHCTLEILVPVRVKPSFSYLFQVYIKKKELKNDTENFCSYLEKKPGLFGVLGPCLQMPLCTCADKKLCLALASRRESFKHHFQIKFSFFSFIWILFVLFAIPVMKYFIIWYPSEIFARVEE